jgi:hypothetical protein
MVGDSQRPLEHVYGKKTVASHHVSGYSFNFWKYVLILLKVDLVIKAQGLSGLSEYQNNIKEGIYKSHQAEPLGKSLNRNYELKEKYKEANFAFGVGTRTSEYQRHLPPSLPATH